MRERSPVPCAQPSPRRDAPSRLAFAKSCKGGDVSVLDPALAWDVRFIYLFIGQDDDEEDDTPVVIPSSAVTTYPRGTPVPTPSVKVQVIEERVDLSNNLTWRQMIGVGVRRVVLARGELDKLEGPQYAARRAELRREAGEAARARDRQAAVALQNEAEESGATEEEATGGRTTRVGRPRGGMRVAARIGDRLRREIGRGRRPRVGDG